MEDMTDRTPSSTPVKVVEFLSPSVPQFCSVCGVDILLKYKNPADVRIKLFKDDKKTSDAGKLLERVLDVKLDYATDLPFVCKNCYRSISNHDKKIEENKSTFQNLRNHVRSQYLRTKAKRCRQSCDTSPNHATKKHKPRSLVYPSDSKKEHQEGLSRWEKFLFDNIDVCEKNHHSTVKVGLEMDYCY